MWWSSRNIISCDHHVSIFDDCILWYSGGALYLTVSNLVLQKKMSKYDNQYERLYRSEIHYQEVLKRLPEFSRLTGTIKRKVLEIQKYRLKLGLKHDDWVVQLQEKLEEEWILQGCTGEYPNMPKSRADKDLEEQISEILN